MTTEAAHFNSCGIVLLEDPLFQADFAWKS